MRELSDHPVAEECHRGVVGREIAADDERGRAVQGAPCGARCHFDVAGEPAGVGDGGDEAPEPVVRGEPGRCRRPDATEEHQAIVRGMRHAVVDVAIEAPAQRLDRIRRRRPMLRQRLVEGREAVVDHAIDERVLVAEVVVDGRRSHAGPCAQLADRETGFAAAGEEYLGGGEDVAAGRLGFELAGAGDRGADGHGRPYSGATFPSQRGIAML
jgi:hypothetical protein